MAQQVRIGIIGAGNFTTGRMLPNFKALPGVAVTAVANRSLASAQKVAQAFDIPTAVDDWQALIDSPEVDAVLIGTPPYLHPEATIAALQAGKHVLCQTRIARTTAEAVAMQQAADAAAAKGVRSMLAPPAPFYAGRRYITHLVQSGYLGTLRHVMAFHLNAAFADPATPLSAGRTDPGMYGQFNSNQLGLTYDVLLPWTGPVRRVLAEHAQFVPQRPATPDGALAEMPYPDLMNVLAETESGAVAMSCHSWATRFADTRIELYGSDGTVVYHLRGDVLEGARTGDAGLARLTIPAEHDGTWRIEEEFVALVRGELAEPSFTFADGVRNMAYLEAAYRSATEGGWVTVGYAAGEPGKRQL